MVSMEMFRNGVLCAISLAAVLTDIRMKRIPNGLIGTGLLLALGFQISQWGILGVILFLGGLGFPILLLWGLYYFRMLGAGDLKLFAVLGAFLGLEDMLICMAAAFLTGGIMAFGLMIFRGNLMSRFRYFWNYAATYYRNRQWKPYRQAGQEDGEFCFTIPIFFSVLCLIGGII